MKKPEYTTRWVFPLEAEPETGIEMRRLKDSETSRIYDRHNFVPGQRDQKGSMAKMTQVLKDVVKLSVSDWKGFQHDGVDIPCNDENKMLLLDVEIENADAERRSLWFVCGEMFDKLERADIKN